MSHGLLQCVRNAGNVDGKQNFVSPVMTAIHWLAFTLRQGEASLQITTAVCLAGSKFFLLAWMKDGQMDGMSFSANIKNLFLRRKKFKKEF